MLNKKIFPERVIRMSTRCYEDFCIPDNPSELKGIDAGVGLFLLAVVFAGLAFAALMSNVDLSNFDFSNMANNYFNFPY